MSVSHSVRTSVIDAETECSVFLTKTAGLAQGLADSKDLTNQWAVSCVDFVLNTYHFSSFIAFNCKHLIWCWRTHSSNFLDSAGASDSDILSIKVSYSCRSELELVV